MPLLILPLSFLGKFVSPRKLHSGEGKSFKFFYFFLKAQILSLTTDAVLCYP